MTSWLRLPKQANHGNHLPHIHTPLVVKTKKSLPSYIANFTLPASHLRCKQPAFNSAGAVAGHATANAFTFCMLPTDLLHPTYQSYDAVTQVQAVSCVAVAKCKS